MLLLANAAALFVSAFSLASGLACGFALIGVGLVMRAGWKIILFEVVASALSVFCYFNNYQTLPDQTVVDLISWSPMQLLGFTAAILGNLLGPYTVPAMILGALGIVLTILAVGVVWRTDSSREARGALLGIMVFGLLSAGLTALGRSRFGLQQSFEIRYVTPPCIFWSAHLLFWSPLLSSLRVNRIRNVLYPLVGAILIIGTVRGQFAGTAAAKQLADTLDQITPALAAGAYEPALEEIDVLDFEQTTKVMEYWKREHLSLFRDPMKRLSGRPLAEAGQRLPDGSCSGTFDSATRLLGQSQNWLTVFGTARDVSGKQSRLSGVLIVDRTDKVVGYASVRVWKGHALWRGYATDPVTPPLRAYAIEGRGTYCYIADIAGIM